MITQLSVWPIIKDHIVVKSGTKLASGKSHRNVEVDGSALTDTQIDLVLAEIAPCARCGDLMLPFRARAGQKTSIFYTVACKLTDCMGCARSRAATEALDFDVEEIAASKGAA